MGRETYSNLRAQLGARDPGAERGSERWRCREARASAAYKGWLSNGSEAKVKSLDFILGMKGSH